MKPGTLILLAGLALVFFKTKPATPTNTAATPAPGGGDSWSTLLSDAGAALGKYL